VGPATIINLHLAVENPWGWQMRIDVQNLLNGYEPMSGQSLDSNHVKSVTAARPRTIGLTFEAKY
jgi:outer membrane receptor protein involved in Fe transport